MPLHPSRRPFWLAVSIVCACGGHLPPAMWNDVVEGQPASVHARASTLDRRDLLPYRGRPLADALSQLRPEWFRQNAVPRGQNPAAVLYVDDVVGDILGLKTIPAEAAIQVQLLSQSEAWSRYGLSCRCPAGAILVRTRSAE